MPTLTVRPKQSEKPKTLLLPEKSKTTDKIRDYLFSRGIDAAITDECIKKGIIFESLPYHNIVFVGFGENKKPKYAAFRATNSHRILGDCSGSDKHYSFRLADSDSNEVHLFECAIDLLSYATLSKLSGKDWRQENLVSLAGVYLPKEKIEDSKTPVRAAHSFSDRSKGRSAEPVRSPPAQYMAYHIFPFCKSSATFLMESSPSSKKPSSIHISQDNSNTFFVFIRELTISGENSVFST